jgi:hypothetical protein
MPEPKEKKMPMVGGKKFPYTKAGKAAAAKAAGKKASSLAPKPPKPPREDVFSSKPDRDIFDVYPGPKDTVKKAKPRPKPERRPVDERGVVRRRG